MKEIEWKADTICLSLGIKLEGIAYWGDSESITFLRRPYLLTEGSVFGSFTEGASDLGAKGYGFGADPEPWLGFFFFFFFFLKSGEAFEETGLEEVFDLGASPPV